MTTQTLPPDLDDLFAQSDDREEYINFRELMEGLYFTRVMHEKSEINFEMLREISIEVLADLLAHEEFFETWANLGVMPFYYRNYAPHQGCKDFYVHKSEYMEALLNEKFIFAAFGLDQMADGKIEGALDEKMGRSRELRSFVSKLTGIGKTKLQEQDLILIDKPMFIRSAKLMIEAMAYRFFPIASSAVFTETHFGKPHPNF